MSVSRNLLGREATDAAPIVREAEVAAWIKRARDLDSGAWDRLYQLAYPQVFRYVSSKVHSTVDAEDITEEVFLGALQTVGNLRATDESGLLGWLFQIARFKIADHLRRHYRRPTDPLDPEFEIRDDAATPEEEALRSEEQATVRMALAELTSEQQEVIVMKFSLGFDNARVATILGKSPGAINQLQHRALGALRRLLEAKKG
jgi:RNA polymerase sigma-70 factor (ECF subfamily)